MYCQLKRQKKSFLTSLRTNPANFNRSEYNTIDPLDAIPPTFSQHFCTTLKFSPERDEGQEDREEERRDRKIKVDDSNLLLYDLSQQGVTTGRNVVHFCFSRSAMECPGVEYAHQSFGTFHILPCRMTVRKATPSVY